MITKHLRRHQSSIGLSRNTVPEKHQKIYMKTGVNPVRPVTLSQGVTIFCRRHPVQVITALSYMYIKLASS